MKPLKIFFLFALGLLPLIHANGTNARDQIIEPGATSSVLPSTPISCSTGTILENFDNVTPPALPSGWSASNALGLPPLWRTIGGSNASSPNEIFVNDPDDRSDKRLDSPPFLIINTGAQLSFRNDYILETDYDGGVLEISIAGGEFNDIIAAGGVFVANGYSGAISTFSGSPISGRSAWTGVSPGYVTTIVGLPAAATGQSIVLRWRMACDSTVSSLGWRIDDIQLFCDGGAPLPTPTPVPTGRILNLSTRMQVGTGEDVAIAGFMTIGAMPVLVRAIGPSLLQFGVSDALADPVLELNGNFGGNYGSITCDNWKDDPAQKALIEATGAPPIDDLESAIYAPVLLFQGTAVARGKSDTSGVALVEIYDLDPLGGNILTNISTRAKVGTGNDVVIAGFIVGTNSKDDLFAIRGIGPSLAAWGVANPLPDPKVELRDSNGNALLANNNWQDDPAQAQELISWNLAPSNPVESAMLIRLPHGLYTVLLADQFNGTGVGLVEIYDVPE